MRPSAPLTAGSLMSSYTVFYADKRAGMKVS